MGNTCSALLTIRANDKTTIERIFRLVEYQDSVLDTLLDKPLNSDFSAKVVDLQLYHIVIFTKFNHFSNDDDIKKLSKKYSVSVEVAEFESGMCFVNILTVDKGETIYELYDIYHGLL